MRKIAVILYGAPGSGKTTQAELLSKKWGLHHLDTGGLLRSILADAERAGGAVIERERKLYNAGKLMTPSFVLGEISREAKKIAKLGSGIVFSGSPRTLYEAEGLMPILEKLYGKKNIFVFVFDVPEERASGRNLTRMMCKVCGAPLLFKIKGLTKCPVCGGPLYRRSDDKPELMAVRAREYKNRTEPIFKLLAKRGYILRHIDARPLPFAIFQKVNAHIEKAARA